MDRISQVNMEVVPTDKDFDPSAADLLEGGEGELLPEEGAESKTPPPIEPFHRARPEGDGSEEYVDDRKEHTCSVVFKAPNEVGEAEMMNYIMGIGEALGVEVKGFNWTSKDPKPAKSS